MVSPIDKVSAADPWLIAGIETLLPSDCIKSAKAPMIRKLQSGQYRLYSRKKNPKTGRRRNLGTFATRDAAEAHERAVQYFKRR